MIKSKKILIAISLLFGIGIAVLWSCDKLFSIVKNKESSYTTTNKITKNENVPKSITSKIKRDQLTIKPSISSIVTALGPDPVTDYDAWILWIKSLISRKEITQKLVMEAFNKKDNTDDILAVYLDAVLQGERGGSSPLEWLALIDTQMEEIGPHARGKLTLLLKQLARKPQTEEERLVFESTLKDMIEKNLTCEQCIKLLSSGVRDETYLNDLRKNPSISAELKNSISTSLAEFAHPEILLELMKDQSLSTSSRKQAVFSSASIMKSMKGAAILKDHVVEVGQLGKEGLIGYYRGIVHSPIPYDQKETFILKSLENKSTFKGMSPEEFGGLELLAFGDKTRTAQTAKKLAIILDNIPSGNLNNRDEKAFSVVMQFFAHCPMDQECSDHIKDSPEFQHLMKAKLDLQKRLPK